MSFPDYSELTDKTDGVDPNSAADINAIQDAIKEIAIREYGGGGGGGMLQNADVWYANSHAVAGGVQTGGGNLYFWGGYLACLPAVITADCVIEEFRVSVGPNGPPAADVTLRAGIYAQATTGNRRGLPGALIDDFGTAIIPTTSVSGDNCIWTPDAACPAGPCWFVVQSSALVYLLGFATSNHTVSGGLVGHGAINGDPAWGGSPGFSYGAGGSYIGSGLDSDLTGDINPEYSTVGAVPMFWYRISFP